MLTLEELKTRLATKFDPNDLLELLNITSEELVEAFADRIEEKQDKLREELNDDSELEAYQENSVD